MSNACLDAVVGELQEVGVNYHVEHGGKHLRIRFGEDLQHSRIVASTPSDWRAPLNERAGIRRDLTTLGYLVKEEAALPPEITLMLVDGQATCTSLDIADKFSKPHKDVLRAIDGIRSGCGHEFDQRNFAPIDYLDSKGRTYRAFRLTRDGFSLIAMGFTGAAALDWKVKYIGAFNAMEAEINRISAPPALTDFARQSDLDALMELVASNERRQIEQPTPRAAFIPNSILARRARRQQERRAAR